MRLSRWFDHAPAHESKYINTRQLGEHESLHHAIRPQINSD